MFDFAGFQLPKRFAVAADVTGRINNLFHDFVVIGHFAGFLGSNPGFVLHDDFDIGHIAGRHLVGQLQIVGENDAAVFFDQNDVVDCCDNVFFLIINNLVCNERQVFADNIYIAAGCNGLLFFIVFHFVGAEMDFDFFVVVFFLRLNRHKPSYVKFGVDFGFVGNFCRFFDYASRIFVYD